MSGRLVVASQGSSVIYGRSIDFELPAPGDVMDRVRLRHEISLN